MKDESLISQLNKIVNHRRDLVLASAVVVVGVVVLLFLVVGQISAILELQNQVQTAQQEKIQLQQKNQVLQEATSNPLLAQEEAINSALADVKPLTQLLTALSGVADSAQVAVTKVNLSPGLISSESAKVAAGAPVSNSTIPGVDIMKIEITVQGAFSQINDFLVRLDNMSPLVIVNVFKLQDSSGREEIDRFEATLTLDTYFYTQSVATTLTQELPTVDAASLQIVDEIATFSRTNFALPTQIVGGGVEDLFGLSQSELERALQNTTSGTPATPQPTVAPTAIPTTAPIQTPAPIVTPIITPIP